MDKKGAIIVLICVILGFITGFTFGKIRKNHMNVEQNQTQAYSIQVEAF